MTTTVTIARSEIPAIPGGTTFTSHEDASYALTSLAAVMPDTWHCFKYTVEVDGEETGYFIELRCGEPVDTEAIFEEWKKFNADRTLFRGNGHEPGCDCPTLSRRHDVNTIGCVVAKHHAETPPKVVLEEAS